MFFAKRYMQVLAYNRLFQSYFIHVHVHAVMCAIRIKNPGSSDKDQLHTQGRRSVWSSGSFN